MLFLEGERNCTTQKKPTKGEMLRWGTWFGWQKRMRDHVLVNWHSWLRFA